LLFALVASVATTHGQWSQKAEFKFDHLTHEHGLSQSTVNAIVQDGTGFMWFGTQDGLNRYDGYNIVVYRHKPTDSTSLSDDGIWSLVRDRAGDIWIGTMRGGLNKFLVAEDRFIRFAHNPADPNSISDNNVISVFQDSRGIFWAGTLSGGLNRLDGQTGRFLRYVYDHDNPKSLSSNTVWGITEDREGNIWLATGAGLCMLSVEHVNESPAKAQFAVYHAKLRDPSGLSDNYVRAIYVDRKGTLWVGTWGGGLERFDPTNRSFQHYRNTPGSSTSISSNLILSIFEDSKGTMWVGTGDAGVNLYHRDTDTFTRLRRDPEDMHSLSNDIVCAVYEDRSGIVWLGTGAGGVSRYDRRRQRFGYYRDNPKDPSDVHGSDIWAILEDSNGELWVSTYNHGLNRIEPGTRKVTFYSHSPSDAASLSHNSVLSLCESRSGDIWIATEEGGLDRYEQSTNRFIHYRHNAKNPNTPSLNELTRVLEDRNGYLWIGTNGGGLSRCDLGSGVFTHYHPDADDPQSLSGLTVMALYEDRKGFLWVGTWGDGANKYNPVTDRFTRFRHDPRNPRSLNNNTVLSFYEDENGTVWMGTHGGGLNRLDPSTGAFLHYGEVEGLPNNVIYGILPDDHGTLWLSTNKGLARFDPKSGRISTYDVRDGLQSNEFNQGAYFRNNRGELFFGGLNGLNVFHPDSIRDNRYIPPVVLTSFKIFDKPLSLRQSLTSLDALELSYSQNYFSFDFVALNFTSPEKNRYAYKLEGLDPDWIYTNDRRYASYTNLDPGSYILRVKAANNDGVWNEKGLALSVTINAPYWRTWWFRILVVVAIAATLFAVYRYRVQKLLEIERLRASIATDLHDDIGSTLTEIALYSDVALRDLKASSSERLLAPQDATRLTALMEEIGSTARNLIDAMNDIVWSIDPKNDSFEFLLLRMKTHAARMLEAKGINYNIDIPQELSGLQLPLGFRRRFFLIYKEAINNVIRHAQASRVTLAMKKERGSLFMTIADNGIGFDPSRANTGNGLRNMRERAASLPGNLTIASSQDAGTTVTLSAHIP